MDVRTSCQYKKRMNRCMQLLQDNKLLRVKKEILNRQVLCLSANHILIYNLNIL